MKIAPPSIKALVVIWLTLVALHFTILCISMLKFGGIGTPLILTLAIIQMILVMLVFMELRHRGNLVRVFAVAGYFWLLIQFPLTSGDYLTRAFH
ncbi:MAG: cytochrome C oxidase subunit IV family protein [Verrucomicrobiota bacterium]|jgi:cytochrome c oxidase subunit 4